MTAFYSEWDPYAAQWLRNLIEAGHIAPGVVDERSIADIDPDELDGYTQCHFFAGIGGWSYALRLAGWPDDRPVWTGSCPCQPFSVAGNKLGQADKRHLWPFFRNIIGQRKPPVVFGEQVTSTLGREWLARVFTDLEILGFAVAASDLCAASITAPHKRQRLYWMANSQYAKRRAQQQTQGARSRRARLGRNSEAVRVDDSRLSESSRRQKTSIGSAGIIGARSDPCNERDFKSDRNRKGEIQWEPSSSSASGGMGYAVARNKRATAIQTGALEFYGRSCVLEMLDGKKRRFESCSFPLAHGIPERVGLLRGYGNAINPWLAAEFIQSAEEAIRS
jgi:DNA (cytosine-5)-methyltransferase 1